MEFKPGHLIARPYPVTRASGNGVYAAASPLRAEIPTCRLRFRPCDEEYFSGPVHFYYIKPDNQAQRMLCFTIVPGAVGSLSKELAGITQEIKGDPFLRIPTYACIPELQVQP